MRKIIIILVALAALRLCAQNTPTPNVGLQIPSNGSTNWNLPLGYNFTLIDQYLGGKKPWPSGFVLPFVDLTQGVKLRGSFGLNGQYLQSTGSGSTWVFPTQGGGGAGPMICPGTSTSGNDYACVTTPTVALTTGTTILFHADATSANSPTLGVNGGGPMSIKQPDGDNIAAGEISIGQWLMLTWTGSFWTVSGEVGSVMAAGLKGNPSISVSDMAASGIITQGGTIPGNAVTAGAQSAVPANWIFDWTTPASTLASIGGVPSTTTVNGHALNVPVIISASDLTVGTLPHAQLPALVIADIPNINESQVTNLSTDLAAKVPTATTVNGHALSGNVVVSASDISTGTLPHAQMPTLASGDVPSNAANTTGTAANLSGNPTIAVTNVNATGSVNAPQHCIGASCISAWPNGNLAIPGPIGGTTPSTGAFTSITASSVAAGGAVSAPSAAFGAVTSPATYDTSLTAFGDSLTVGLQASVPANNYISLWSAFKGWTLTNKAVSSTQIDDMITSIEQTTFGASHYSLLQGVNDMRFKGTDATWTAAYTDTLKFALTYMALPTSQIVLGKNAATVGSWPLIGAYGLIGRYSVTTGDKLTATVTGSVVYIGSLKISTGGTFSVSVDGINQGSFTCLDSVTPPDVAGLAYHPFVVRLAGFTNTAHTVVVTQTQTGASTDVEFIAGNTYSVKPMVWLGNTIRYNAAGYALAGPTWNHGSDAAVAAYNTISAAAVASLVADGLAVSYVDASSVYNITTDIGADGVHPNDTGYLHIAGAFEAVPGVIPTSLTTTTLDAGGILEADQSTIPSNLIFGSTRIFSKNGTVCAVSSIGSNSCSAFSASFTTVANSATFGSSTDTSGGTAGTGFSVLLPYALSGGSLASLSVNFLLAPNGSTPLTVLILNPSGAQYALASSFTVMPTTATGIQTFTSTTNYSPVTLTPGQYIGAYQTTGALSANGTGGPPHNLYLAGLPTATPASWGEGSGSITLSATIVAPIPTSSTISLPGMTPSGHCSTSATSAAAAANPPYISAKGANQITITNAAIAGMSWDVMCTP